MTPPDSARPSVASPGARAKPLSLLDSIFLYGETGTTMMHVAALLRFTSPPGAGPDYLARMVAQVRAEALVQEPWSRKLKRPKPTPLPLQSWVVDEELDLDYHFRHSALPAPGGERELGNLISRLHSNALDLERPPWELHVIEGLENGDFAIYVKMHHALVDGYSAMRMLERSLPPDREATDTPILFAIPPRARVRPSEHRAADGRGLLGSILDGVAGHVRTAAATTEVAGQLGGAVGRYLLTQSGRPRPVLPFRAPDTILNARIGSNRRFATQDLALPEIKRIATTRGATVNDVCLAVLGGALRRFLTELDGLPADPLIAFVPVNLRPEGDTGGRG